VKTSQKVLGGLLFLTHTVVIPATNMSSQQSKFNNIISGHSQTITREIQMSMQILFLPMVDGK